MNVSDMTDSELTDHIDIARARAERALADRDGVAMNIAVRSFDVAATEIKRRLAAEREDVAAS